MNRRIRWSLMVGCLWTVGCAGQRGAREPVALEFISPEMQACVDGALRHDPDPSVLPLAFTRFKEGCDLGDAAACSLLGVMYERGLAVPKSALAARSLFARSCNAGNEIGCSSLLATAGILPRDAFAGRAVSRRLSGAEAPWTGRRARLASGASP